METNDQLKIVVPSTNSSKDKAPPAPKEKKKRGRKPKHPPESKKFVVKQGNFVISFD